MDKIKINQVDLRGIQSFTLYIDPTGEANPTINIDLVPFYGLDIELGDYEIKMVKEDKYFPRIVVFDTKHRQEIENVNCIRVDLDGIEITKRDKL